METLSEEQECLSSRIAEMIDDQDHDIDRASLHFMLSVTNLAFTALNLSEGRPLLSSLTGLAAGVTGGITLNYVMSARSTSETIATLEAVYAQSRLDAARQ